MFKKQLNTITIEEDRTWFYIRCSHALSVRKKIAAC